MYKLQSMGKKYGSKMSLDDFISGIGAVYNTTHPETGECGSVNGYQDLEHIGFKSDFKPDTHWFARKSTLPKYNTIRMEKYGEIFQFGQLFDYIDNEKIITEGKFFKKQRTEHERIYSPIKIREMLPCENNEDAFIVNYTVKRKENDYSGRPGAIMFYHLVTDFNRLASLIKNIENEPKSALMIMSQLFPKWKKIYHPNTNGKIALFKTPSEQLYYDQEEDTEPDKILVY